MADAYRLTQFKGFCNFELTFFTDDLSDANAHKFSAMELGEYTTGMTMSEGVWEMMDGGYGFEQIVEPLADETASKVMLLTVRDIYQPVKPQLTELDPNAEDDVPPPGARRWLSPGHFIASYGMAYYHRYRSAWEDEGFSEDDSIGELDKVLQDGSAPWRDILFLRGNRDESVEDPTDPTRQLVVGRVWTFWDKLNTRVYVTPFGVMVEEDFKKYMAKVMGEKMPPVTGKPVKKVDKSLN